MTVLAWRSICAQGELDEGSLALGLRADPVRMTAGVVRTGPGGYIHSISHVAGEPAISIHAYSPPLTCVGQYRADQRADSSGSPSTAGRSLPTRRCLVARAGSSAPMSEIELGAETSSDVIGWRERQLSDSGFRRLLPPRRQPTSGTISTP